MLFAQHSVQEFLHKDGLVLSFKRRAHRPTSRLPSGLALHFPWRQQDRGVFREVLIAPGPEDSLPECSSSLEQKTQQLSG